MSRSRRCAIFVFLTAILLGGMASCVSDKNFPDEPVINSVEFDSLKKALIINFTDGDGDFGIENGDPRFEEFLDADSTIRNPYYYNLWVDYFEKREGEWVMVHTPNTFNFRVPNLTPQGQNKQIEVRITYDLKHDIPLPTAQSDTIKFSVVLVDRAKHESLPKETDAIVLPSP